MQAIISTLGQWAMRAQSDDEQLYLVGLNTTRLLMAAGDLLIGWLLIRQADVALAALTGPVSDKDRAFYEGKVETARWFAANRLPLLTAEREIAAATDLSLMRLPEEAF